ncbi:MAG: hypothetical protein RMJ60_02265, partial [Anaerolineales bacterium]|nr:hypothetical protein [Anaerolineales bacterium]
MSDLFETIKSDRDIFSKLLAYVPGFSGYLERQNRRAADKMLRDQVALRYEELQRRLFDIKKDLVDAGEFSLLEEIDSIGLKLTTLVDRLRTASYGYSGFFDSLKINEEELAQLYAFDAGFFTIADQIDHGLHNITVSIGSDGLKSAIRAVNTMAVEALETFDKRYQVISGSAANKP